MSKWVEACGADDVELEGVIRFDSDDRTFAVYRSPDGEFYCTDGLCTHEFVHLADGFVMDYEIECPKHSAPSTTAPAPPSVFRRASIFGLTRCASKTGAF